MENVLVALSGGVDSAVAALRLLRAGHRVSAAYMRTWMDEGEVFAECPWEDDIAAARAAAEALGITFEVVNMIEVYRERVVAYLVDGYRRGITPNPDVMCNREIKFGALLEHARARGFDAVATGHYCRRRANGDGSYDLLAGADPDKDQSYFLALVRQGQLARARFPVGDLTKGQVREMAAEAQLPNAQRKDSQGICFLGRVRINDFLQGYIPDRPGEIVDPGGRPLGEHRGLHRYTIGQRRGIGVPSNRDHEHYVVVGKQVEENRLVVALEEPAAPGLFGRRFDLDGLSFINRAPEKGALQARARYRDPVEAIDFTPRGDGGAEVVFARPQRALAPGQVCALYADRGQTLLGGGVYRSGA